MPAVDGTRGVGALRVVCVGLLFPVGEDEGEPLYRRVRRGLEGAILAGRFEEGRLPSSREVAAELGVSRNTVNLAYQELITDGVVIAGRGPGMW